MTHTHTFRDLNTTAEERILILDGSMGYMIQQLGLSEADFRGARFANHPQELKGCNDILCLVKPQAVSSIHEQYINAGADIIETCSFNANAISLADYALEDYAYEINKAAALIARAAADKYPGKFVAGSMGPTSKSASISPDVHDPGARSVTFDELAAAYREQARGLLDGGVDILLIETVFDALNARAALSAAQTVMNEYCEPIPVMVSLTIAGETGRLLTGQTIKAFCATILPFNPWAVGLNCSFGADTLKPHVQTVADFVPCYTSVYPNAGLPNFAGEYDDTPDIMTRTLETYMDEGVLNIVGGCCGTTPAHIKATASAARKYKPRAVKPLTRPFYLSGLEILTSPHEHKQDTVSDNPRPFSTSLIPVGERSNVAGSRRFLRLIKEERYADAVNIAREMVENGAKIIDVCMDDALLDAEYAMTNFLNNALSDPDVAKVPIMVDSSQWDAVVAGLKCVQGKSLVNSISLKEGEALFLEKAQTAREFGAAVVVMLFDEEGQAATYERKVAVAERSYRLLVEHGFPACDIVFDPNVLSICTGVSEHDAYALDFLKACSWIRGNCPLAQISGGISNLSFSFRGADTVREAMHSVFLHHAIKAGLSMAIVNPATLVPYEDLAPDFRTAAEDAILCRSPDAAERLLALASAEQEGQNVDARQRKSGSTKVDAWRTLAPAERVRYAMLNGADEFVTEDVLTFAKETSALGVVEGALMGAMREIGALFGEGKLFLPQVVRSARVMKKAVGALEPLLHSRGAEESGRPKEVSTKPKVLLATVKGDVHDIGKNIVSVILACNGYEVLDLGVMVSCEAIVETATREKVDAVGLSGLITPSLEEMIAVARAMQAAGLSIPLLIGGAAASLVHTALKIAPEYYPVVYSQDASQVASQLHSLLASAGERDAFLTELEVAYQTARESRGKKQAVRQCISLDAARANRFVSNEAQIAPHFQGIVALNDYPLERVVPFIDWKLFFYQWGARSGESKEELRVHAEALLARIVEEKLLALRGVIGLFPARSEGETVTVFHEGRETAFTFPRNLEKSPQNSLGKNLCLADFIPKEGWMGLFALSAGFGVDEFTSDDEYSGFLFSTLANTLAEAFAEEVHLRVRTEWWGYSSAEKGAALPSTGKYPGARFGFGYPTCPNHEDKQLCFDILHVEERIGVTLTESFMMSPTASVCGLLVSCPEAFYFTVE